MSKAKAPRVFVPLTKVDEEQRLVYGTITQEILDKSGEVMDYDSSKPHFQKWSDDIHTASGGLSKGNVRVMHGLSVAGKLTELEFNDDDKSIEVCAKVVDDAEWNKVTEGCYTGFSVGGSYGKKWTDTVDGAKVKKFEAKPNEVSLVDNPCVPSATFTMVKADGAEAAVEFQVENDDSLWPAFSKADAEKAEAGVTNDDKDEEDATKKKDKKAPPKKVEKAAAVITVEPTATQVAEKAGELAKAAADGTTWQDHIEAAREELVKASPTSLALEQSREGKKGEGEGTEEEAEEGAANAGAEDEATGDEAAESDDSVEKVTPPGVKQVWTASDGKTFEKKADAETHEASLVKTEPTAAEKLKARMEKALSTEPPIEETGLMDDFDRLAKAVAAITTPFDDNGEPKLEKGMYTINRFSSVLSDMASLSRCIKAEGVREGGDSSDSTVSADLLAATTTLGKSFLTYAADQVTELLAGMDDEVVVSYHDYYYNAAQTDPENGLAKDVCSLIGEHRDPAGERREELSKAFGIGGGEDVDTDELTPTLQKRFDALEAERDELAKVAGDAVEKVEELAKRMQVIEDTPLPRAPRNAPVGKGNEDGTFFGKAATTEQEKTAVLHDMIKTHGPDQLAIMMIKASQASGGQQLSLKQG